MKLTEFSLRNPLVVVVVAMTLISFGTYAFLNLGVGITPNVSFPQVVITTTFAGADPATVETQLTKPIEDAVATLQNVDTITSTSDEGVSTVSVQFTTAANTNLVSVDVERVINAVRNKLPSDADPPSIIKFETSEFPVLVVALSGPQEPLELQRVATDTVQRSFEAVPGVQSVTVSGGEERELHVKLNMEKLRAYGIGINTVQQALQSEQIEIPAGSLGEQGKDLNVRLNALIAQPSQLGRIIVASTPTGRVYLSDVATIEDGAKKVQVIDRVNGKPAVSIVATKAVSANTIMVSQGVRATIARLQPSLPSGMRLDVVNDAATYTQQSFNTIRKTLGEAILLTGIILLLFLHTWRSTLIVMLAIPTSLLTTFGLMSFLGLGLDLFSMLALTLSVGILVDDSIVILENIYRHLGLREPPVVAARNGRVEIGLAAITITAVDVAVYLPIALLPGIAGDFIRPFAVVIACATLTSLLVSFTLTPLLASRFLTLQHALMEGSGPLVRFGRAWDHGFDVLGRSYRRLLRGVLQRKLFFLKMRWIVIAAGLASFVVGLALPFSGRIGFDIFPSGDQSEIDLTLTMPPATSLETTNTVVKRMEETLQAMPEVHAVYSNTGTVPFSFGTTGGDTSQITVLLVPPAQRSRSSRELADKLRQTLDPHIARARLDAGLPNAFGFGGFGGQPIQIAVRGPDPDTLNRLVDQVTATAREVPGAVNVNNANEHTQPEAVITVDRDRAADLGVTAQAAGGALRTAVGGTVVAKYRRPGQDDVDIRLEASDVFVGSPDNLSTLPLLATNGTVVQLGQIGSITRGSAPTEIAHYNRERSITVNASASGRLVGDVQRDMEARIAKISLPPGYSVTYGGQAQTGASAFADLFKALGIGVVLIYVLMTLLFGSVTLPVGVLMSLPLAVVGALGGMALTGTPFTLFSLLGFAVLLGLVGKNAILLVDYTDTLRKRGYSRTDALLEAGPTRLRPIVMTTMSIFVALAPLVLGLEAGSELLKASAVVLMGGLLTSTLLTLVFVPAMYTIFDDIERFVVRILLRFATPRRMEPEEMWIIHPRTGSATDGAARTAVGAPPSDGVHVLK